MIEVRQSGVKRNDEKEIGTTVIGPRSSEKARALWKSVLKERGRYHYEALTLTQ